MTRPFAIATLLLALAAGPAAQAAEFHCSGPSNVEEFHYVWRLRGGLSWLAGFVFPTSGAGKLKTTYPERGAEPAIQSEFLLTPAGGGNGFYVYESKMAAGGEKTLMTYHGYAWGNKSRKERTVFDYVKRLVRIRKETPEKIEDKVRALPPDELRDILTAIHYLRQNAGTLNAPVTTNIYSDGKEYPVVFRPGERRTFTIDKQVMNARAFEIVDAPGGKKWPGSVRVFVSDDARRIPFRIEVQQSMASIQFDLSSVESCGVMAAAK